MTLGVNFLRAGDLIHIVTIEQPNTSQDGLGKSSGWIAFASNLPARVMDMSAKETYLAAQRMADQVSHVVKMRYFAGITGKMRVNFGGRILQIQGVLNPDGKQIEHQLVCLESATNA